MLIYIPEHLRKIPVVEQMYQLLVEYSELDLEKDVQPFDNYHSYLKNDPVKQFVQLRLNEYEFKSKNDYNEVVNFITKLFYTVKGTERVLELMRTYLFKNQEIRSLIYSPAKLTIEFNDGTIQTSDESLFYDSLNKFLSALLFFGSFDSTVNTIDLVIEDKVENFISKNILCYKHFCIKR